MGSNSDHAKHIQWILCPGFMGACDDLLALLPENLAFSLSFYEETLLRPAKWVTEHRPQVFFNEVICLNPNNPGDFKRGDSPNKDYLESAISFIKSKNAPLRVGLGYSMGARILLQIAAQAEDLFDALIVLSPHPGLSSQEEHALRWQNDQSWARALLEWPWEDFIKRWNAQPVFGPSALEAWSQQAPPSWEVRHHWARVLLYFSLAHQPNLRSWLQNSKLPILWVVGALDKKFVDLAQDLSLPSGEIAVIPEAYHRVYKDQTVLVKKRISEFLKNRLKICY